MTFVKVTLAGLVLVLWPITTQAQDVEAAWAAYGAGDHETAAAEWRLLAEQGDEQGDKDAQYRLGVLYDHGRGVAQDFAQAARW